MINLLHNNKAEVREVMEYYERIRAIREDRDMKQSEVAAVLGTDQSYYSKYERGVHPMTAVQIKKLALFFNVSADYLPGITDSATPIF